MTVLDIVLLILCISFITIISFITGAKVGQKVVRGETVEMPKIEPIKAVREAVTEYKESKEAQQILERDRIIADNIDAYNGTSIGQKDIPRY